MTTSKRVLVIDTSLLCVWLKVPQMETCGETGAEWDYAMVDKRIQDALSQGYTLVLPLASIIETGNHIAHAPQHRRDRAIELGKIMTQAADAETPWAAFQHQAELWSGEQLKKLATTWPPLADSRLALGDATITRIGDYYAKLGCTVKFLTADQQLSAYEPPPPILVPRRRQR